MGLPYAKALPGEKPWKPLAQHRAIERAFSALEVAPVRKNYGEPAKDPHLAFETGIPKPAPRTKQPRRIRDLAVRSEEHTSELQSRVDLVCRLLLEKKKQAYIIIILHNRT